MTAFTALNGWLEAESNAGTSPAVIQAQLMGELARMAT